MVDGHFVCLKLIRAPQFAGVEDVNACDTLKAFRQGTQIPYSDRPRFQGNVGLFFTAPATIDLEDIVAHRGQRGRPRRRQERLDASDQSGRPRPVPAEPANAGKT